MNHSVDGYSIGVGHGVVGFGFPKTLGFIDQKPTSLGCAFFVKQSYQNGTRRHVLSDFNAPRVRGLLCREPDLGIGYPNFGGPVIVFSDTGDRERFTYLASDRKPMLKLGSCGMHPEGYGMQ